MADEHSDNPLHPNIGGRVFFNPGTGPVIGATLENAEANMEQYIKDSPLADELAFERYGGYEDEEGRFRFYVYWKRCEAMRVSIDMPGWELERVRYMGEPGQDVLDFPRLYVDGGSWIWSIAVLGE